MELLDSYLTWFIENIDKLRERYVDGFVVIKNSNVIGHYKSFDEAYKETMRTEQLGTFLIQDLHPEVAQFANENILVSFKDDRKTGVK